MLDLLIALDQRGSIIHQGMHHKRSRLNRDVRRCGVSYDKDRHEGNKGGYRGGGRTCKHY